jgi:hypothetical protein
MGTAYNGPGKARIVTYIVNSLPVYCEYGRYRCVITAATPPFLD